MVKLRYWQSHFNLSPPLSRRSLSTATRYFSWFKRLWWLLWCAPSVFIRLWFTDKNVRSGAHSPVKFRSAATVKIYRRGYRDVQSLRVTTDFTRLSVMRSFPLEAAEICMLVIRNRESEREFTSKIFIRRQKNSFLHSRRWFNFVPALLYQPLFLENWSYLRSMNFTWNFIWDSNINAIMKYEEKLYVNTRV